MRIEPELSEVQVVLLGSFNPAILTPAWFALHELLPEAVADTVELKVAHPNVVGFSAEWLQLDATHERFTVGTAREPYVRLHDLVAKLFEEHLHHTPLKAFGINRAVHFRVKNFDVRDRIGRQLAPLDPWGPWASKLNLSGVQGGMTSLTMSQNDPEGRPAGGRINVTVEPSVRIADKRSGIFVRVNDHYEGGSANSGSAKPLMRLFRENFDESLDRSEQIIDYVMSLADE